MLGDMRLGMYILFLVLIIIMFAVRPLIAAMRQSKKPPTPLLTENERIKFYVKTIAFGWCSALVLLIVCLLGGIGFYSIGFRGISLSQNIWFTSVTFILCGLILFVLIYRLIAYLVIPKYREKYRQEYKEDQNSKFAKYTENEVVNNLLLPRSKKERKYFFFLSLTAGIWEEVLFRGFIFFLLQAVFPNMPMPFMLLIVIIIFGMAHAYQGIQGIIRTMISGALYGSLFLVMGSLILPMFLHFVMDISDVFSLAEDIN